MIRFADLATQHARNGPELDAAIAGVLNRAEFVLGPQIAEFEAVFADCCRTDAAIGHAGTRHVLVDIAAASFALEPERIGAAITPRTRAIVQVTLARPTEPSTTGGGSAAWETRPVLASTQVRTSTPAAKAGWC